MTTAISTGANALSTAASKAGGTSAQDTGDKFLTLLIAQMKAQDPMNPMDNSQMTSQMAQLSTVSGIEQLNTSVKDLSSSLLSAQLGQGAGLLDKTVIAEGNSFSVKDGAGFAAIELTKPANSVSVDVINSAGVSVKNISLVNVNQGATAFQMADYGIPDGNYSLKVTAKADGEVMNDVTTLVQTRVKNLIPSTAGGFELGLANGSVIGMDQIRLVQSV
jgi:flagellar basal-body rod modification protein FlgD